MPKLKKVKTISELSYLCNNGKLKEQYTKLAAVSAQNLGGRSTASISENIQWLSTNAMETSEDGVVDEINFCLDLVQ